MKIYLSGGMEFKKSLGIEWREWITAELEKIGHIAIDPTKLELDANLAGPAQTHLTELKLQGKLDEVRSIVRNTLFRKDMWGIQMSDVVLVLYDESVQKGAGTLSESWEAFREGRPVYLVTEFGLEKVPTWLIGETTAMFFNFEDFLAYASDNQQLEKDVANAKQIAKEVLQGIYEDQK